MSVALVEAVPLVVGLPPPKTTCTGGPRESELSACENKGDHEHQRLHHPDDHCETHGILKELRQLVVEGGLVEPEPA